MIRIFRPINPVTGPNILAATTTSVASVTSPVAVNKFRFQGRKAEIERFTAMIIELNSSGSLANPDMLLADVSSSTPVSVSSRLI